MRHSPTATFLHDEDEDSSPDTAPKQHSIVVVAAVPFAEYLVDHFSVKARRTGALGFQKVACMRDFLEWLKDSGFDHTNFSAV
jgi:hypothetical protein